MRKNVTDLIRWANTDFKKTSTVACAVKQALCLFNIFKFDSI